MPNREENERKIRNKLAIRKWRCRLFSGRCGGHKSTEFAIRNSGEPLMRTDERRWGGMPGGSRSRGGFARCGGPNTVHGDGKTADFELVLL